MILIHLLSALTVAPRVESASVSTMMSRDTYHPDARHRALAATLAFGLAAALIVAVALSPMIIARAPQIEPGNWTSISLPRPKPPIPQPEAKPHTQRPDTHFTAPPTPIPPQAQDAPQAAPQIPYVAPMGAGSGPAVSADPPLPPTPRFVIAELDMRFAGAFQPDYPPSEQRRGIEGVAKVHVLIGTDGRVKAVELVRTDSPGFFDETRRRALSKWRFKPATRGGVAEESWQTISVRFQIRDA